MHFLYDAISAPWPLYEQFFILAKKGTIKESDIHYCYEEKCMHNCPTCMIGCMIA